MTRQERENNKIMLKIACIVFDKFGVNPTIEPDTRKASVIYPIQLAQTVAHIEFLIPCAQICGVLGRKSRTTTHSNVKLIRNLITVDKNAKADYDYIVNKSKE